MALGDGSIVPAPPTIYGVYRAFYILPTDRLPNNAIAIDFFATRSVDNLTWEIVEYLGRGDNQNGLYFVHGAFPRQGLDENTYYAYHIQYIFSDGSKGPIGALAFPGQAQLIATSSLNIDQLASRAYSTGLVTSGIFQGVIFRTDETNPKVQMDPSGIFATNALGQTIFYLHDDGSAAYFSGTVDASTIDASTIHSATITGGTISGGAITGGTIASTDISSSTIESTVITGGTIQTSSGNPKVLLDGSSNSMQVRDGSGTTAIQLDTSGVQIKAGTGFGNKVGWYSSIGGSQEGSVSVDSGGNMFLQANTRVDIDTSGPFITVFDSGGNSAFVQTESKSNIVKLWGQYSSGFSLAGGATTNFDLTDLGWNIGGGGNFAIWLPIAYLNGTNCDFVTWCVAGTTSTSITFYLHNYGGSTATGNLYMVLLTANGNFF